MLWLRKPWGPNEIFLMIHFLKMSFYLVWSSLGSKCRKQKHLKNFMWKIRRFILFVFLKFPDVFFLHFVSHKKHCPSCEDISFHIHKKKIMQIFYFIPKEKKSLSCLRVRKKKKSHYNSVNNCEEGKKCFVSHWKKKIFHYFTLFQIKNNFFFLSQRKKTLFFSQLHIKKTEEWNICFHCFTQKITPLVFPSVGLNEEMSLSPQAEKKKSCEFFFLTWKRLHLVFQLEKLRVSCFFALFFWITRKKKHSLAPQGFCIFQNMNRQ